MGITVSGMPPPQWKPWMMFVDGENFTRRARDFVQSQDSIKLLDGKYYSEGRFVWVPPYSGTTAIGNVSEVGGRAVRSFYYATAPQNEIEGVKEALWKLGFQPSVFMRKMRKDNEAAEGKRPVTKGVDIALARDFLSNAFLGNYDIAVLVAEDGDYVPLLEEVKRLGKRVYILSFGTALSDGLRLASDGFFDISAVFFEGWQKYPQNKEAWDK